MLRVTHPGLRAASGAVLALALIALVLNFTVEPLRGRLLLYALVVGTVAGVVFLRTATVATCQQCGWRGSVPPWRNPRECPGCEHAERQIMNAP